MVDKLLASEVQTFSIDLFTTRHKVVNNGESPNFKGLLFDQKTNYLAQILQSLSYNVCSIILPKFNTFGLFIPIMGTSAIMDQTTCCYNVTTSETDLLYYMGKWTRRRSVAYQHSRNHMSLNNYSKL